ncbi:GL25995 [Drosophila persimilis]|uniref:GL25995 n=1 Tax=Drosophila persimilis TaxID=7234 RepID=B4GK29_DROPE|nr:GL25995 [Drosophila persimilis]
MSKFHENIKRRREGDEDEDIKLAKRFRCLKLSDEPEGTTDILNDDVAPLAGYDPDLSPIENPFYWNKNKILYDLHLERLSRMKQNLN